MSKMAGGFGACSSPFFSLLFFLFSGKGVLFHHGFSGSSCSGWFRCLSPFFSLLSFLRKGYLFHHDLLVRLCSGWGSGACLPSSLFFLFSGKGVLFHHGFSGSSWFRLGFRCLSPFFSLLSFLRKGVLFHHDLLVRLGSGWVPVLVSLLLSSFFPQERSSVPSWISWCLLLRAGVPVLVSLLLPFLFFYCLVFVRLK